MNFATRSVAALLAAAALVPAAARAETYVAASTWNDIHAITVNNFTNFGKRVAEGTRGAVEFEVFHSASLLPPNGSLSGLASGLASYANITSAYIPADLPLDNVLNDLAFVATDPLISGLATTEVKLLNSRLQEEYSKQGVVFGNGYSTLEFIFICRSPIASTEDLKGRKIRTVGSAQIAMAKHFGAVPVSVPATEMYSGLQRGSIDCTTGDPSFLTTSFKLQEVAKSALVLGLGTHTSGGNFFDKEFWQGLKTEDRQVILHELGRSLAELEVDWIGRGKEALGEAAGNGVQIAEPTAEMRAALEAFKADYVKGLAASEIEMRKVADPSDIIAQYLEAEAKWTKLIGGIDRSDPAAVAALVESELFGKIDPATYGMN